MKLFGRIAAASALFGLLLYSPAGAEFTTGEKFAIAIEKGDLEAVKELVEGGAKADTRIEYGEHKITPLMKACWEGNAEIAEYLLDKGANVNAADERGQTALFSAVMKEDAGIVEMLIKRGAKVNLTDSWKSTPLAGAVAAGNLKLVTVLAGAGADLKAEGYGLTPLMSAASTGNGDMVRLLVKLGAPVNQGSKEGDPGTTALFHAITSGKADMVRLLIELKANVNVRTKSGDTPLKAAKNGDLDEIIGILKEAGAKK